MRVSPRASENDDNAAAATPWPRSGSLKRWDHLSTSTTRPNYRFAIFVYHRQRRRCCRRRCRRRDPMSNKTSIHPSIHLRRPLSLRPCVRFVLVRFSCRVRLFLIWTSIYTCARFHGRIIPDGHDSDEFNAKYLHEFENSPSRPKCICLAQHCSNISCRTCRMRRTTVRETTTCASGTGMT